MGFWGFGFWEDMTPRTVKVYLTNKDTDQPISGVTVSVENFVAETDFSGFCELEIATINKDVLIGISHPEYTVYSCWYPIPAPVNYVYIRLEPVRNEVK